MTPGLCSSEPIALRGNHPSNGKHAAAPQHTSILVLLWLRGPSLRIMYQNTHTLFSQTPTPFISEHQSPENTPIAHAFPAFCGTSPERGRMRSCPAPARPTGSRCFMFSALIYPHNFNFYSICDHQTCPWVKPTA